MNINGLTYIENFISPTVENQLLAAIDSSEWLGDLKRRVQHYGYKYDYKKRHVDYTMHIGDLPDWAAAIAQQIQQQNLSPFLFNQLIINEYEAGQGITAHIDCEPCFENCIASLSLGTACAMNFYEKNNLSNTQNLYLQPRSLLILRDEARFNWLHGIKNIKNDVIDNQRLARGRRVSLTFRKVIL